MKLVVFSQHYPYGSGEEFLEDEIHVAERFFEKITIVSGEKNTTEITKYVPKNAEIVDIRRNKGTLSRCFGLVKCVFMPSFWKEVLTKGFGNGFKGFLSVALKTFLDLDYIRHIKAKEKLFADKNGETVYYSYWLNAAATYLAKRKPYLNGLCVSRAHGWDCFFDRGFVPFRVEQLKGLDEVFSVSAAGASDIVGHYENTVENLRDKIHVSRLGIDIPQNHTKSNFSNNKTIVSCSNIIPLKRLDLLIDALAQCQGCNIEWIHFGDGNDKEKICALAVEKLKDKENLTFCFKGQVRKEDIFSFYENNAVDVFVNCSDTEGIPVSVMEAMVRGIPAIARNVGANAELVNDDCGLLLPKTVTSEELANAIMGILSLSETEYLVKKENAIKTVKNGFNAKQNYIKFFEQITEMSM